MKTAMSMNELLVQTNSDGVNTRIEIVALPKDLALQDRFALVMSGPAAAGIAATIIKLLDDSFSRAQEEADGPVASTPGS